MSVEIVSDESTTHQKFPTPMLTAQASAVTCLLAPIPTQQPATPHPQVRPPACDRAGCHSPSPTRGHRSDQRRSRIAALQMAACHGTVNERVVSHLPLCMGLALYIAACLLFAYAFYQRVLVSVYVVPLRTRRREQASPACAHSMTDKLMEDLDVGASGVATLGGSYYFAYASLQIVSVLFVDWFGVVESLVRTLFAHVRCRQFTCLCRCRRSWHCSALLGPPLLDSPLVFLLLLRAGRLSEAPRVGGMRCSITATRTHTSLVCSVCICHHPQSRLHEISLSEVPLDWHG